MARVIGFLIFSLLTVNFINGQVDLNSILNGVFTKHDQISKELQDAVYYGQFYYLETNDKGETLKTMTAKRKIYTKGFDKHKSEYLEMTENNRVLSKTEIAKQAKKGRAEQKSYSPFDKDYRTQYNFSFVGEDKYNGLSVWVIGFSPKYKGKGYLQGEAKILKQDSCVVAMSFVPTGLPFVVKNFNITLSYGQFNNYWMPKEFRLSMEVDVKVLVSLAHKYITMREEYSGYTFNNGLLDSFFE